MAELKTYVLQKGFNQVFNRIENCELVPAPFDKHINTWYTYASKRKWLSAYQDIWSVVKVIWKYLDSTSNIDLVLATDAVYSFTSSAHTSIAAINADWVWSIIWLLPWWTVSTSGTATWWSSDTLIKTAAWWTINAYAWLYIWLNWWTWAWDIQQIESNTVDTIKIVGWTSAISPTWTTTFRIYPKLCFETLITSSVVWANVKFFDWTTMQTAVWVNNFKKAIIHDGRYWYLSSSNPSIILYSEPWQPFIIDAFVDTWFDPCLDIVSHGSYIII